MNDSSLADKLVSYADALAALAFVGTSGLGLALADPDVRCSLVKVVIGVGIATSLLAGASAEARRISRFIFTARIVVVWLAAAAAVALLVAATQDPRCSPAA